MTRRKSRALLDNPPHDPTWRQIIIKAGVWLIVGTLISFLVFIVLVLVKKIIDDALAASLAWDVAVNPLLPIILMIIAFLGTFIGSVIISAIFNLVYTTKYYDMSKMFTISLIINVLLFVCFIPLYLIFAGTLTPLFLILALHIFLAVFLTYAGIEITTNPNYAWSDLIWSARWFTIGAFFFLIAFNLIDRSWGQQISLILSLPPILAYFFVPLFQSLREKIYYKFYSMGNNFLYIPSLHEVMVDAEESSQVNVDM